MKNVSSDNEFHLHENKKSFSYLCLNARIASGVCVPRGQGLQQQSHPKAEEHPQAYQPATQLRAPPPPPPPYYSTRHTEARNSVKVEWQKKNETERRGRGEDPKPKKAEGGGGTKRNATLLEQNATPTKLRVQRKHNIGTCHGLRKRRSDIPWDRNLPPRSRTMVNTTNADAIALQLQTANTPPKKAKDTRDHNS